MRQSSHTEPPGGEIIKVHPLMAERRGDQARLFGPAGAEEGGWDTFSRVRSKEYAAHRREVRRPS